MIAQQEQNNHQFIDFIACVLQRTLNTNPLLCYGSVPPSHDLPEDASETVTAWQQDFIAHLGRLLTAGIGSSDSVLLCGPSVGQLAHRLADAGYHCVWLGKRALQQSEAHENLQVAYCDFADYATDRRFAAVLVEGTQRYLDQLAVLQKARSLLQVDGLLILAGEYLPPRHQRQQATPPNLSSCLQLSARLGIEPTEQQDFTVSAVASLQALRQLTVANAAMLTDALAAAGWSLDEGLAHIDQLLAEFVDGRRQFSVLSFINRGLPDKEFSAAEFTDIHSYSVAEIGELFTASFGVEFNPELWRWKYQLGQGRCVLARQTPGGPVVAHYGGAPRRIRYFGQPELAIQVCDVMVMPGERRRYGKQSLFFKTAATFLEREIGYNVEHLLGFGFPNQKAMNIAKRLGLYQKTDDFVEVVYARPESPGAMPEVTLQAFTMDSPTDQQALNELWQRMGPGFVGGIIGVRDSAYVQYRYHQHPAASRYQCFWLHVAEQGPLAFVVLKQHNDNWLLMDIVCPESAVKQVLQALCQWAAQQPQSPLLMLWVTRGWLEQVLLPAASVNALNIEIPCNDWNPGPKAQDLYGRWWLTAGDMDFM